MSLNENPTSELHTILVGIIARVLPRISSWWILVKARFISREWLPGKNCSVRLESLKYCPGSCTYSESVWQGCVGQEVFVDVGLTWRVTPRVSEGRTSRTTVRARVSTPWWETILATFLRKIKDKVVTSHHITNSIGSYANGNKEASSVTIEIHHESSNLKLHWYV